MIRVVFLTSLLVLSSAAAVNHASAQVLDVSTKMKLQEVCWRVSEQRFCAAESVGYVRCTCLGSMINHCSTVNDNTDHPSCSGFCLDSEMRRQSCQTETMIGPPRDPFRRTARAGQ